MARKAHLHQTAIVVLLLAAAGRDVVAGDGKLSPETDLAAPGAPLYEKAVKESVRTLMSKEEQAKLGSEERSLSPGPDYYWCKNCKTYHKKKRSAHSRKPATAQNPAVAPAASPPSGVAAAAKPPSPGPDFFWCAQCKTYHKKQASPNQRETLKREPNKTLKASDFFYCEKCKTYHRRQPPGQQVKHIIGKTT